MTNTLNYNHLFRLIDSDRTFNDVGDPQNILKTAVVMNLLMAVIVGSMCLIPVPFLAPIVLITYIISFVVLNIKYMSDFATAVYQSDNLQIQKGKLKYKDNTDKIHDLTTQVNKELEEQYQAVSNTDKTLTEIYTNIFAKTANSMSMFNKHISDKLTGGTSVN